jgi:hypothetical protein
MKKPKTATGQASPRQPSRVCGLHLSLDGAPDLFSIETILRSVLRPGMTHEQRARALRDVVWSLRYNSPDNYPQGRAVVDPIVLLNAFPGTICSQDAAALCALWIAAGYDARAVELAWHTTAEVRYEGAWHNFDATLWERRKLQGRKGRRADAPIASTRERGPRWRKPGAADQRWDDFDAGHTMDFDLRRGESFTRYWYPLGTGPDFRLPSANRGRPPADTRDRMHWAFDLVPRAFAPLDRAAPYANGLFDFQPDLAHPAWRSLTDGARNMRLADGMLGPVRGDRAATVDFRVRSPYPVTGARLNLQTAGGRDRLCVRVSTDDGASWRLVTQDAGRAERRDLSLGRFVRGAFVYLVRIDMPAGSACRLCTLRLRTWVAVNPFALPALKRGANRLHLSATHPIASKWVIPDLTQDGCLAGMYRHRNVRVLRPPHVPAWAPGLYPVNARRESQIVYRVACPGAIQSIEWGGRFLTLPGGAAHPQAVCENTMQYSFDGKTWHSQPWTYRYARRRSGAEKLQAMHLERIDGIPPGLRQMYLSYRFRRRPQPAIEEKMEELLLASLRIRADYRLPAPAASLPLNVTYCWHEDGGARRHTECLTRYPASWTVHVGGRKRPVMKWIRVEAQHES